MPILGELARWGYEWAWGAPRSSEAVDIGAIFRLAPGLLERQTERSGTVECTVTDGRQGDPAAYLFSFEGDRVTIVERARSVPDARSAATPRPGSARSRPSPTAA